MASWPRRRSDPTGSSMVASAVERVRTSSVMPVARNSRYRLTVLVMASRVAMPSDATWVRLHGDTVGVPFIERLASREIYRNPWLVLREDDIRRPDGSSGIYSVVDKQTYALVMPYDGNRFRLVEQFRYPLGARRWEFPQGTAPDLADVEPSELAERELREETGLRASSFEALGQLDTAPGMTSQRGWVFLATGISEGEADREHEEQDMRSAWFPREEVEQMMRSGLIADAQSIAAYGLFLLRGR